MVPLVSAFFCWDKEHPLSYFQLSVSLCVHPIFCLILLGFLVDPPAGLCLSETQLLRMGSPVMSSPPYSGDRNPQSQCGRPGHPRARGRDLICFFNTRLHQPALGTSSVYTWAPDERLWGSRSQTRILPSGGLDAGEISPATVTQLLRV